MKSLRVLRASYYQADLRFLYDETFGRYLSQFPGCYFDKPIEGDFGPKRWIVPIELLSSIIAEAEKQGYVVDNQEWAAESLFKDNQLEELSPLNSKLHPYQRDTVLDATREPAWLINHDMRLGKSMCALEVLRLRKALPAIIITPRMAAADWLRYAREWFPDAQAHVWDNIITKKELAARCAANLHIVSYGLLEHAASAAPWEAIILDEIHYIQNERAQRTKLAFAIAEANPDAIRLGLTGTIISTHVDSMFAPLDWLWPDRFGTLPKFKWRYMQHEEKYDKRGTLRGHTYSGSANAAELNARLAACSSRITKSDPQVAHLFPPYDIQLIEPKSSTELSEIIDSHLKAGHSTCVMSYTRENADYFADYCDIPLLSGDLPAKKRGEVIAGLREKATQGEAVAASATISATKVGVGLSFFDTFVYTDLSYSIEEMTQSIARGHEMYGVPGNSGGTEIYLYVTDATRAKAEKVALNFEIINAIIKAGPEGAKAGVALAKAKAKGMTEAEFAALAALAQSADDYSEVE